MRTDHNEYIFQGSMTKREEAVVASHRTARSIDIHNLRISRVNLHLHLKWFALWNLMYIHQRNVYGDAC